ncbi:MAG: hypothetical protein HOI21_00170 [Bacteroidetes Order II. Incertae sedis bacterium]|jgi:hypothetical protein|nr:hypothetical protein [Bacteroidetes Order II. bacterium]
MLPEELQERMDNFAMWKAMTQRQRIDLWSWNKTDRDHFSHKWSFPMFSTSTSTIVSAISRRQASMADEYND